MVEHLEGKVKRVRAATPSSAEVVGALSAVIRAEHRHAAHLAPAMRLGLTDVMALYHLADEPLTAGVLRDRVGLSTGSTTALVDRLIKSGLVKRGPHPSDRRAVLIELTGTGRTRTFTALQHFIGDVETICADLSTRDRSTVSRFLRGLTKVIDADTERLKTT